MATALAMCLKALGHDVDEDEVNEVMGARPMKGARWEEAMAAAQHYGCRATLITPCTVPQLKEWTDRGVPVMISWNPEDRDWSHASVVFDVTDGVVHVADPNIPDPTETVRAIPESEFYGMWGEKWPNYIVRRVAMAIDREITPDGRQVQAAGRTAEEHDCWKDWKAGGLTWAEYQECLRRFQDIERSGYRSKALWFYNWAEIARLIGKDKDASFIESVGSYVERKGYMSSKQGKVIERMKARYRSELKNPKATLAKLKKEKKDREEAEAKAHREELDAVRALAKFDKSKWRIEHIETMSHGGDTIAQFREDDYYGLVFWFRRGAGKDTAGYVTVKFDGEKIFHQGNLGALDPEEAMEFAQGVIAAHMQGLPIKKAPSGGSRPAPEPKPELKSDRHTFDRPRTDEMIAVLDTLIDKGGPKSGMFRGFKGDLERGKGLTEKQLKAIRHNLYKNRMRSEADHFRVASPKRVADRARTATDKARRGDLIQSFNVTMPVDTNRSSYLGTVTKVETDDRDGVEYVHYKPICRLPGGGKPAQAWKKGEMRAPQNGTPTSMGEVTDGIYVIK
jgi:hypothetical protein